MFELVTPLWQWLAPLCEPLLYPFDPTRRIFLGFMIVALIMAFWFYKKQNLTASNKTFLSYFFDKNIWLHRSSILDMKLIFANTAVVSFIIAPLIISKLLVIIWVSGGLREQFGSSDITLPYWLLIPLFTLVIFIAEDFKRFIMHYAYHKVPVLWAFHKVHHSAEVLTPLTLYRAHPVETLLARSSSVLVLGLVTGVFVYLFPGQLSALEILGVDALGFVFNALGANLRHSHVPLSFGRLERWFISPVMHQAHHSQLPQHIDKNFGSCFSVWDRMFGSFYQPCRDETLCIGCHGAGRQTVLGQWFAPLGELASFFAAKRWSTNAMPATKRAHFTPPLHKQKKARDNAGL